MRALINDVLILSRLDEKALTADEAAPVNLASVAERAAGRLESLAREADVAVGLQLQPAQVQGNETLLEQMIHNLVENAIRYNRPGGRVTVKTATALDAEGRTEALVQVGDSGPGIPADAQDKVFERFYRLDKSRSKETGGTGLGLAIVKHAALHHGGTVELQSEEGQGATFTVHLPTP